LEGFTVTNWEISTLGNGRYAFVPLTAAAWLWANQGMPTSVVDGVWIIAGGELLATLTAIHRAGFTATWDGVPTDNI
jgi:hypothetical protein